MAGRASDRLFARSCSVASRESQTRLDASVNGHSADAPSMSRSYSHETSTMSSPSFASTVTISPSGFLKWSLMLRDPEAAPSSTWAPFSDRLMRRTPRRVLVGPCRREPRLRTEKESVSGRQTGRRLCQFRSRLTCARGEHAHCAGRSRSEATRPGGEHSAPAGGRSPGESRQRFRRGGTETAYQGAESSGHRERLYGSCLGSGSSCRGAEPAVGTRVTYRKLTIQGFVFRE